ncbi:hypothetical protein J2W40_002189 [Sphingobium xenophagum]|uniref:Lysozyme inhibitor LprI N-terminal domain-containing protein n=1 Tax=Sphingobium xenophagum TaxID=121428 RepID=A0ABU1X2G9_SPHXE|nr:hypothetical protein [Sphingobium xenophagum]MDR7155362.1 hypothetical protein [Sphingobium xenophagum]
MRALAILPAMIAMPNVASAAPLMVCAPTDAWDAAMARYCTSKADLATYERSYYEPNLEAQRAKFGEDHPVKGEARWLEYREWRAVSGFDAVVKQCDIMAEAEGDAQVALLRMPAPHLTALRWKLEQTFELDGEIALWVEDIALTIRSDFLRLLPGEA